MNVVISNLPGDVTEELLLERLQERNITIKKITLSRAGNSKRCSAILSLDIGHAPAVAMAKRIDGLYWHGRFLRAHVMVEFTGEEGDE